MQIASLIPDRAAPTASSRSFHILSQERETWPISRENGRTQETEMADGVKLTMVSWINPCKVAEWELGRVKLMRSVLLRTGQVEIERRFCFLRLFGVRVCVLRQFLCLDWGNLRNLGPALSPPVVAGSLCRALGG